MTAPKPRSMYISVQLTGNDGNAFSVLGAVKKAMKLGGCTKEDIDAFYAEATNGDYNHLLATSMATVTVH